MNFSNRLAGWEERGAGRFPAPLELRPSTQTSLWLFHPLYPAPGGAGGSEPPESPLLAGRAGAPRRASQEGVGCGALCAQLPRAAGWSLTRGRQTRGGGLGWDSSQHGGRVQFCAETALQPRARRPVLWFSVLFHGISRKQLPRDQRPHSPADATVTDTPHTHTTSPGPAAHTVFLEPCPPRAAGSSKEPGTEAGDGGRGWRLGLEARDEGRGRRPGTEAGAGAQAGQVAGP